MPSPNLDNLVKSNVLKAEPPDQAEFDGLLSSGRSKLKDSELKTLSLDSRFDLSYSAAHALALAALRWHGYRSNNKRYAVFQCLAHTSKLKPEQIRVLSDAHEKRNRVEYEGAVDVSAALVDSIVRVAKDLLASVEKLGPVSKSK